MLFESESQLFCKIVKTKLTFVNGQNVMKIYPNIPQSQTKKEKIFMKKIKCLE